MRRVVENSPARAGVGGGMQGLNPTEETVLKFPNSGSGAIEVSDSPHNNLKMAFVGGNANETTNGAGLESLIITPAGSTSRVGGCPKIDRETFSNDLLGPIKKKSSENSAQAAEQ